jgi:hypothetical protein
MTGFSEFTTEEMVDELLERKVAFRIHLKSGIVGDWDGAYDWADDGEWVAIRITEEKLREA